MADVKVYDIPLKEIDEKFHPVKGDIFVALDPQERLGPATWSVSIQGDGTALGDTVQLGLFWVRENAIKFAKAYK